MRIFNPSNLISQPRILLYCFFAGAIIWLFNELNNRSNATMYYPINFKYDEDGLVEVVSPPKNIEISINGTGWNLLRNLLKLNIVEAEYNINKPRQTKFILSSSLIPNISQSLENVSLNYVVTDSVFLDIEKKRSKEIQVLIDSSKFLFAKNHERVSNFSLSHKKIIIEGPQSIVKSISNEYYINNKEVLDLSSDFNEDFKIELDNKYISASPNIVNLNFSVEEYFEDKVTLKVIFNENDFLLDTLIVISYKFKRGQELSTSDSLDVTLIKEGNYLIPQINGAERVEVLNISPNSFILD